jgi:hypothetical protein
LRCAAAVIALALAMLGGALVLCHLLDLLLIFFLGAVVARSHILQSLEGRAALQQA